MKLTLKILLPLLVLGGALLAARAILGSRPEPVTRPERVTLRSVEATRLARTDYPVLLRSRGAVRPTTANTLVAEVAGSVTDIADDFVAGGTFRTGDTLVELDRRDLEIAQARARANLAQAVARLEEQEALAEQARIEWDQLGRRGEPSALTLREPQLAAARADRDAAAAELERAELDLERTVVRAPYDGLVLERAVDPGQFVARGAVLGRVHAIDAVEVSLPLGVREQAFLALPRTDPPLDGGAVPARPAVELEAASGGVARRWRGELVRVEGIDEATRQLVVVARVPEPWADPDAPLRVGQYVEAEIEGRVLEDVFVIPRNALREGREVLIVDEAGTLRRRDVVALWADDDVVAVSEGLADGELLVLTPLATVVDGTPVRVAVDGAPPEPLEPAPGRGAGAIDTDSVSPESDGGSSDAGRASERGAPAAGSTENGDGDAGARRGDEDVRGDG